MPLKCKLLQQRLDINICLQNLKGTIASMRSHISKQKHEQEQLSVSTCYVPGLGLRVAYPRTLILTMTLIRQQKGGAENLHSCLKP